MEQRNNLVLQGTETFSRGALDNVALESGALVLDSSAGRYLPYGSYTTPEFAMPAFCNLNVSWNASAPHNTMVGKLNDFAETKIIKKAHTIEVYALIFR